MLDSVIPTRILVTGTGTDVGKTTIAAQLARALRDAGHRVLALKPIETGFVDPAASDAAKLAAAAGHPMATPYFSASAPVAPMRAALDLALELDLAAAAIWIEQHERAAAPRYTVVESAGGLFTPTSVSATNLDLIRTVRPHAWLLVTRDRLGVLHDCLATLSAARAAGCSPDAVILGASDVHAPPTNLEDLQACTRLPVYRDLDRDLIATLMR
jgi:dethiobiotin synthase